MASSLCAALMHHVTDGHVLEYPGICHGGFAWDCELDLNEVFGTPCRSRHARDDRPARLRRRST